MRPDVRVQNGLATLGPAAMKIRSALEARFTGWAEACGSVSMSYPPLMEVGQLERLDYFQNFPHLMVCTAGLRPEVIPERYVTGEAVREIPAAHLEASRYVAPSAACYHVYFELEGQRLEAPIYVTTVAQCFRNEREYVGLRRLWSFNMREIVCIGEAGQAQAHLGAFKQRILSFAAEIGLPLTVQTATDPFYDPRASRAVMQRLFPVKEEFVYGGEVAIASINFHRNFFGERCDIRVADGSHAYSGCVAFGLERWIHALLDHFGGDAGRVLQALDGVAPG